MHSIRSHARRAAWYNDNKTDPPTYNFFGRTRTNNLRKPSDLENALRTTQTENDARSPIEDSRRQQNATENAPYGTQRSTTFGAGASRELDVEKEKSRAMDDTPLSTNPPVNGLQPTQQPSGVVEESTGGPRKRKLRKFMLCASKDDPEDSGVHRSDTSSSKKKKKHSQNIPIMSQFKAVFASWINILLVFVPVGIAVAAVHLNGALIFALNFFAIIPLAAMLSFATEELALYVGETLGGLLNATFGNAVELIVSVIALTKGEIIIVQTSLIGSMLSNLLLVLGMCFFFGGLRREEQFFNVTVAQTAASLLALAIGSLIIPTVFGIVKKDEANIQNSAIAPLSRGTSIMLLVTYACYLYFQLHTHVEMYNAPSQKVPKKSSGKKESGEANRGLATIGAATGAAVAGGQINQENLVQEESDDEDEEETPQLTLVGSLVTLLFATVLIAVCAEFMVDGIGAVAESVSQEFIGLILLPIVGNAAEHATAVTVAIKDKMDLSIGVAVGSSLQIALLILPITVLLSWWGVGTKGFDNPNYMTLNFDGFLIAVLFISIILVNYLIQDGKSHWLEGVMLNITYLIIATAAWFYPVHEKLS